MRSYAALRLAISEKNHVGDARRKAVSVAEDFALGETSSSDLAIVVTELATNLARHAVDGHLMLRGARTSRSAFVEVLSVDRGPGMERLDECLRDGFSTGGSNGTGLGAIRRLSHEWDIYTQPGVGTVQVSRIARSRSDLPERERVRMGFVATEAPGEILCGDDWRFRVVGSTAQLMVVDGLGHGEFAAAAAYEATAVFDQLSTDDLGRLMSSFHQKLRATRGAAVSLAHIDFLARTIEFSGVGNVGGFTFDGTKLQRFVCMNGIVGSEPLKTRSFSYPIGKPAIVVLHSDGLTTRTDVSGYAGLYLRDPAVIAGVLHRDFLRGKDDATVAAISIS